MISLQACGLSHIGQVRQENQDTFLINGMVEQKLLALKLDEAGLSFSRFGMLCAVADGMGGHRGGSVASRQVLETLALEFPRLVNIPDALQVNEYLHRHILAIHHHLLERGAKEPELTGMGTTLLGVYLRPDFGFYFHLGDSRLYRLRAGALMQLTSDHSAEAAFGAHFADPKRTSKSGAITNCLGGNLISCSPDIKKLSFLENDLLLLCSDGLSDMLELETMETILKQRQPLVETVHQLVDKANTAGVVDNITLVVIKKEGAYYD